MCLERCTPLVRHCTFTLCWIFILINKVEWRDPQNIKQSKTFYFFVVDCNIVDAKLVFVSKYSVVSDVLIETGVRLLLNINFKAIFWYYA